MLSLKELRDVFSSEQVFVVLLARLYFGTVTTSEVNEFLSDNTLDNTKVYRILRGHALRPFACYVIRRHNLPVAPALLDGLNRDAMRSRQRSMRMMVEIFRIFSQLKLRGVTVIPYKGPVFAESYFPDLSWRESSDIDFLIDEKDIAAVEDFLLESGYKRKKSVARKRLGFYSKISKDIVYTTAAGDGSGFSVEMHWRLMDKFSGDYPGYGFFSAHTEPSRRVQFGIEKLQPTYDFLAVISNHFVKDISSRFKYLVDIAALVSATETLDTNLILATARRYRFSSRLQMGMDLIERLIGVRLPGLQDGSTSAPGDLRVPLQLPPQKLYLSDREFLLRSIRLQDNKRGKARFAMRYLQYIFIRGYVDVTALNIPVSAMLKYMLRAPFRMAKGKSR